MRTFRRSASLALLAAGAALGLVLAARPAQAQEPQTLTVAMSGSYWPLHAEAAGGVREGFEADLAADLARLLGRKVRFVGRAETGAGAIDAVAAGKADIAMSSITATDDRRKLVDFTRPYVVLHYRLAARAGDAATALDPAGKRIAAPRGPAVAVAKALLPRATIVEVGSPDAAVQAVLKGSADLAFAEDVGLVLAVAGRGLALAGPPLAESPVAIAVPKGQAARYDEALAKLSGRIAELIEKYRPGEPPELPALVFLNFASSGTSVRIRREPLDASVADPDRDPEWRILLPEVGISVAARVAASVPPAVLRAGRDHLDSPGEATWIRLDDGTFIGVAKTESGTGWDVVAVRGDRVSYTSFDPAIEEGT